MQFNSKIVNNNILAFFVFGSLFITFRVLLIGSDTSQSPGEYFISVLPEIFVLLIAIYFLTFIKKNNWPVKFNYFDWMIIAYIISNLLIGVFIAKDLKLSIYGARMTYFPMIFYFIGSLNIAKVKEIEKLIDKIFNWFLIIAIIGLVLYFGFYDTMISMLLKTNHAKSTDELQQYFIIRMTSIFWTPVIFGTFMAATFLYFFYKTLVNSNWINYLFQMIAASCILLSVSRGPMMISVIGVLLLFVFYKKWKVLSISALLSIFILIGVSSYISYSYKAPPSVFIKWIATSTTETVELKEGVTRVDLWIDAADNLWYNMLGVGLGKAGHVGTRFANQSSKNNVANTSSTSNRADTSIVSPAASAVSPITSTVSPTTSTILSITSTISPTTSTVSPTTSTISPTTSTISPTTSAKSPSSATSSISTTSTDGWYLKIANETGVFGLISYFVLVFILLLSSIKYLKKNGVGFYSFLFTIFIIVNIQNVASNVLDFYLFSNLYWFIIGLMVLHLKLGKVNHATA